MQTTVRYKWTYFRMSKVCNSGNRKCWQHGGAATGTLTYCWRTQNGTTILQDGLAYKTKHILTIWWNKHSPWCFSQRLENTHTKIKYYYTQWSLDDYSKYSSNWSNSKNYTTLNEDVDCKQNCMCMEEVTSSYILFNFIVKLKGI